MRIVKEIARRSLLRRILHVAELYFGGASTIYPEPLELQTNADAPILILTPHADDETLGMGGTIHDHVTAGHSVVVLEIASSGNSIRVSEEQRRFDVAYQRRREFSEAMKSYGIIRYMYCGLREVNSGRGVDAIGMLLSSLTPGVIYLPSPFDNHHDHRKLNALMCAVLRTASSGWKPVIRMYEVWTPMPANRVHDISHRVDAKREAIQSYTTQNANINYARSILGLNAYRAMTFGDRRVTHAEAFLEGSRVEFQNTIEQYFYTNHHRSKKWKK